MQYSTISKVHTENGDDIHLRFGFDMTQAKLIFSIIVAIANKPEPREFQADTVEEIIAWLRFNRLSKALFNSPQFGRKYNLVKTEINTVQNGINKETNTPINTEEKINIVDINSSTSSVV